MATWPNITDSKKEERKVLLNGWGMSIVCAGKGSFCLKGTGKGEGSPD